MKSALVLGGGGSKGAYEIGVWQALRECGVSFDLVCGTSIGALIGTMIVQDQYDECRELWEHLSASDVIANGVNLDFDLELLMGQKGKYKTVLQGYVTHKGADISPFEHLVAQMFDAPRFFGSPIDFACMSVNASRLHPHAFTKGEMRCMQDPCEALLASAACFPAFPMRKVKGDNYIDGGYYDNVPIRLARSLGAEKIIAVDLKSVGTKKLVTPQADVLYIEPYVDLGSFLLFDQERIRRNIRLGYLDAMKKMGRMHGYLYSFAMDELDEIHRFEEGFAQFLEHFAIPFAHERIAELYHSMLDRQLNEVIRDFAEYDHPYLRMLELSAFLFELNDTYVYSFASFLQALRNQVVDYVPSYEQLFDESKGTAQIMDFIKDFSIRDLVYYVFRRISLQDEKTTNFLRLLAIVKPNCLLLALILVYVQDDL